MGIAVSGTTILLCMHGQRKLHFKKNIAHYGKYTTIHVTGCEKTWLPCTITNTILETLILII